MGKIRRERVDSKRLHIGKKKTGLMVILGFAIILGYIISIITPQSAVQAGVFNNKYIEWVSSGGNTIIYRDKRTGVNYLMCQTESGTAITVMYDANGKPLVTAKSGEKE